MYKNININNDLRITKPLISVLMPAYNHQNYVQEAIESIINQTYKNIELIVIDDGSRDDTWQKIQEIKQQCEKRFVRVVLQTKENEGTCATLNKMLDLAQGEFVYLIASDDKAKPQAIEKEADFLVRHKNYALVVGDDEFIDSYSKVCYWDEDKNIVYDKAKFKTFADFLSFAANIDFDTDKFGRYDKIYHGNHIPNGYLIRKSIFDKIGKFTNEAPLEDWWLMLQIAKYAKMKFLNEILYSYRWHNSNSIKNRKKIDGFAKQNIKYENHLLGTINDSEVLPSVLKIKYGYLYKTIGIPYIFVLEKYNGVLANKNIGGGGSEELLSYLISLSLAGQNNSAYLTTNPLKIYLSKSGGISRAF